MTSISFRILGDDTANCFHWIFLRSKEDEEEV